MLQPVTAHLSVASLYCLALMAQLQRHCRMGQLQIPARHSPHDFHALQLPSAHARPLQPTSSGWRSQSKGTSLKSYRGGHF